MKNLGRLATFILLTVALGWPQSQINSFQILRLGQQTTTPANPPTNSALIYFNSSGTAVCIKADGTSCFSAASGTVTSIATTSPISGGTITGTGTITCSTCTVNIASGTKALATGAISSAACTSAQTATATGTLTTDTPLASFNGDPTAVTGYVPLTTGMLTIIVYPTTDTVNFKVCNNTSASITPGAITLNWKVIR